MSNTPIQNYPTPQDIAQLVNNQVAQAVQAALLQYQLEHPPPQIPPPPNHTTHASTPFKIPLPDKFDGNPDNFRGFLLAVEHFFTMSPAYFTNDLTKINFFVSLLSGPARSWYNPIQERPNDFAAVTETFITFKNYFTQYFCPAAPSELARIRLQDLHQGKRSVAEYAAEFRNIAADLATWTDDPLIHAFDSGLSQEIRKAMFDKNTQEATISGFINAAITCDHRLQHRKRTFPNNHPPPRPPAKQPSSSTLPVPKGSTPPNDAMDVDSIQRQRLSPAERQRRLDAGECLVCASKDHIFKDCPLARHNRLGFQPRQ